MMEMLLNLIFFSFKRLAESNHWVVFSCFCVNTYNHDFIYSRLEFLEASHITAPILSFETIGFKEMSTVSAPSWRYFLFCNLVNDLQRFLYCGLLCNYLIIVQCSYRIQNWKRGRTAQTERTLLNLRIWSPFRTYNACLQALETLFFRLQAGSGTGNDLVAEALHYPAFPCCLAVMANNRKTAYLQRFAFVFL